MLWNCLIIRPKKQSKFSCVFCFKLNFAWIFATKPKKYWNFLAFHSKFNYLFQLKFASFSFPCRSAFSKFILKASRFSGEIWWDILPVVGASTPCQTFVSRSPMLSSSAILQGTDHSGTFSRMCRKFP